MEIKINADPRKRSRRYRQNNRTQSAVEPRASEILLGIKPSDRITHAESTKHNSSVFKRAKKFFINLFTGGKSGI